LILGRARARKEGVDPENDNLILRATGGGLLLLPGKGEHVSGGVGLSGVDRGGGGGQLSRAKPPPRKVRFLFLRSNLNKRKSMVTKIWDRAIISLLGNRGAPTNTTTSGSLSL